MRSYLCAGGYLPTLQANSGEQEDGGLHSPGRSNPMPWMGLEKSIVGDGNDWNLFMSVLGSRRDWSLAVDPYLPRVVSVHILSVVQSFLQFSEILQSPSQFPLH